MLSQELQDSVRKCHYQLVCQFYCSGNRCLDALHAQRKLDFETALANNDLAAMQLGLLKYPEQGLFVSQAHLALARTTDDIVTITFLETYREFVIRHIIDHHVPEVA